MSSQRTYYADATGIRIGTARLVFPSATYATTNVSAVAIVEDSPTALGAYVVMAIGAVMFLYGALFGSVWGFVGVLGILSGQVRLYLRNRKRVYGVRLTMPEGPVVAFAARNRRQVQQVTAAVRRAVAAPTEEDPEAADASPEAPAAGERRSRSPRPSPSKGEGPRGRVRRRRRR